MPATTNATSTPSTLRRRRRPSWRFTADRAGLGCVDRWAAARGDRAGREGVWVLTHVGLLVAAIGLGESDHAELGYQVDVERLRHAPAHFGDQRVHIGCPGTGLRLKEVGVLVGDDDATHPQALASRGFDEPAGRVARWVAKDRAGICPAGLMLPAPPHDLRDPFLTGSHLIDTHAELCGGDHVGVGQHRVAVVE